MNIKVEMKKKKKHRFKKQTNQEYNIVLETT